MEFVNDCGQLRSVAVDALIDELIDFCGQHLARFKCPRSVDFDPDLPRSDAGKVLRRRVRERYW